jgi:hypothetical protein
MRKGLVVLLCVMGLVALSISCAQAGWYTCSVSKVGMGTGGVYAVTLTDIPVPPAAAAFTNRTFGITTTGGFDKQMYAAALTALANSTNVEAYINPPAGSGYNILGLKAAK